MTLQTETARPRGGIKEIYVFDDEDKEATRRLIFRFRERAKVVEYYPQSQWLPVSQINFEGFDDRPAEINGKGFFRTRAALNALHRKLNEAKVTELVISRTRNTGMRQLASGRRLTLNYADFQELVEKMRRANSALQADLRATADAVFHELVPRQFALSSASPRSRLTRLLGALDESVIPEMSGEEIDQLMEFASAVIERRYVQANYRHRLMSAAKLRIDNVALSQVIGEFEGMLADRHSEADWGRFLRRNLFLVESRYVHILDRLNVVTAGSREVDFGLVDTHGFLDIFEIKKPDTPLLSGTTDRGNHYWSSDATKAITQAEKYLYRAEQRAATLQQDIRRELNTEVQVTRPRTLLIMGNSAQLDSAEKVEDLRVLRMAFKNIEIILYDELLDRLKNQREKMGEG